MDREIHVWEAANIGKAPFRCVGLFEIPSKAVLEANPQAYANRMREAPCSVGTCRVCGMPLRNNFIIKDANGKLFPVGCECVLKTGDNHTTTELKRIKREAAQEKRAAKREAERQARLQEQRARNGGLTDYELAEELYEARMAAKRDRLVKRAVLLAPLAEGLEDGKGGFRDSVADGLRKGELPKGRGLDIMVDILAKNAGRRNSKAYEAEVTRIDDIICRAQEIE